MIVGVIAKRDVNIYRTIVHSKSYKEFLPVLANATLNMKCYFWKDVSDFVLKEQIILAITGVIFFLLSLYLAR